MVLLLKTCTSLYLFRFSWEHAVVLCCFRTCVLANAGAYAGVFAGHDHSGARRLTKFGGPLPRKVCDFVLNA